MNNSYAEILKNHPTLVELHAACLEDYNAFGVLSDWLEEHGYPESAILARFKKASMAVMAMGNNIFGREFTKVGRELIRLEVDPNQCFLVANSKSDKHRKRILKKFECQGTRYWLVKKTNFENGVTLWFWYDQDENINWSVAIDADGEDSVLTFVGPGSFVQANRWALLWAGLLGVKVKVPSRDGELRDL